MDERPLIGVGTGRWRIPAGSLVIDAALVLFIVFAAGQMTKAVEVLDKRVAVLEARDITPEAARRISVVEVQQQIMQADTARSRAEVMARFDRLEDMLQTHMNNAPRKP